MNNKLKVIASATALTVAAAAQSFGATNTVVQNVNVAFTAYTQDGSSTNKAGVVSETVKTSAFVTKNLIQLLVPSASTAAKLQEVTVFVSSTNIATYNYTVASIVYSNTTPVFTNKVVTNSLALSQTNISFTVAYTNSATNGITNLFVTLPVVNGVTTNSTTGLSYTNDFFTTNTVTAIGTTPVSGLVVSDNYFQVADKSVTNVLGTDFSLTIGTNEFNGTDKVIFADDESGTIYSIGHLNVSGANNVAVHGFLNGNVNAANVGTKKTPLFVNYTNVTINAAGSAFLGATATNTYVTNNGVITTNTSYVGGTSALLKGTVTTSVSSIK